MVRQKCSDKKNIETHKKPKRKGRLELKFPI